jgi:hypothetical protein
MTTAARLAPALAVAIALSALVGSAAAQPQGDGKDKKVWASCSEHVPPGAIAAKLDSTLPERGMSGYVVYLDVSVTHGPGETVMPGGFEIQRGSEAMNALRKAGWVIPEPDGGAGPSVERGEAGEKQVATRVRLPFVPLPPAPGRHELLLPPMPITVARAGGELMTLCTEPLTITIDDPIANEVDPEVKPNPPPRPQREDWLLARQVALAVLGGLILAVILALLFRRWMKRPKVVVLPPPPLPWIAAWRDLQQIRASNLLAEQQYDVFIDRVSEVTRRYLGDRYGFDGLESTSEEIRAMLKRVRPRIGTLAEISSFLEHTDLIKFAEVDPLEEDCSQAIESAESIVRATTPATQLTTVEPVKGQEAA